MRARSGEAGFTLVEVLISILLTVIAVVGIMGLYRVQTRSSGFSRHNTEASVLAEDKMEQVRSQTAAAVGTCLVPCAEPQINERGIGPVPPGLYTRTTTITADPLYSVGEVRVDVTWVEQGVNETVTARGQW